MLMIKVKKQQQKWNMLPMLQQENKLCYKQQNNKLAFRSHKNKKLFTVYDYLNRKSKY